MPRGGPVFGREATKPRTGNSLVASASVYNGVGSSKKIVGPAVNTSGLEWERVLWGFYDTIPEYRFGCDWVGNMLSQVTLDVAYKGKPTKRAPAQDALASLFNGPEGQAEMLRLLGINFTVAGEAWLIGVPGADSDQWKVASATKITTDGQKLKVEGQFLPPLSLARRLWKAHPEKSSEPNSPSKALIPVLSELQMLTEVVAAQGQSRLTSAGILWVPNEMELPAMPVTMFFEDEETSSMQATLDNADALYNRLIAIAKMAIENRASAAAQVPLVVAAPGEFLEKIQKTEFWSGFDEHAKTLRDEAIRRVAIGMDMPPEIITGTADVNHWGSWQIEEAAIKAHTEPLLSIILSSLAEGYLRPYLEAVGVADPENYTFTANTSRLRLRPNRSREAIELWDRGQLSGRTMLIENGFDPEVDAMDDQEKVLWLLWKAAGGSTTPDQVAAAMRALGVTQIPAESPADPREERPTRSLLEHPSRDIPEEPTGESIAASAAFVIDGVLLASEAWVRQALRRTGNRLKNRVGTKVGVAAPDLYLSVEMSAREASEALADAWDDLDNFEYPGVDPARLKSCLNDYTLMLLRLQKPHRRESLARHLIMGLVEDAA